MLSTLVPLWKKAQKKPKNNIISDTINKIKPRFRPLCTTAQWYPIKVLSLMISKNHFIVVLAKIVNPIKKTSLEKKI